MIRGRVIGEVWATKMVDSLLDKKILLVAQADSSGGYSGRVVVAFDLIDAGIGDDVLVSFGSGARNAIKPGASSNYEVLTDCMITQVNDGGA